MRIDPTGMSPEQIAQMNQTWMEMQKNRPNDKFLQTPKPPPKPISIADDFRKNLAPMSDDRGFFGPRTPFGGGFGQPSYGGGFGRPSYGRGFGGPSYGGGFGGPSFGGIGSLFSQLAYMPEDVYNTGMQRFQQSMPMFGNYGFGQMQGYGQNQGYGQRPGFAPPRPMGPMGGFDPYMGGPRNYMTDASGLPPGVQTMMPSTPTTSTPMRPPSDPGGGVEMPGGPVMMHSQASNPYSTGYGMGFQQPPPMSGGKGGSRPPMGGGGKGGYR